MAKTRSYHVAEDYDVEALAASLVEYLQKEKNLTTQYFKGTVRIVIQCRGSSGKYLQFLGMDEAVTVELLMEEEKELLTVTVGSEKWMDKIGAAAVGLLLMNPLAEAAGAAILLFNPLFLTSGIGALIQKRLPEEIFDFIEGKLSGRV